MFVFKAAVVGAGTMGGEIAQVIASAGIPVLLKDIDDKFVGAEHTLSLITTTTSYDGFGDVDFVIEAVPEKIEVKHEVFSDLDAATPGHAVLASNTSALSITEIGDATNRPDKVVGFHFFSPASAMRLVEVVEGEDTSQDTIRVASNFAQAIRKTAVRCAECPGFVVNRILAATAGEIRRSQEETGEAEAHITQAVSPSMARDMHDAYGDRFYVAEATHE